MRTFGLMLCLVFAGTFACGDGADPGAASADVPSWYTPSGDASPPGNSPGLSSNCKFEPALEGRKIGDQVGNFSVKDAWGKTYTMHQTCGTSTKAIWVILAAGW